MPRKKTGNPTGAPPKHKFDMNKIAYQMNYLKMTQRQIAFDMKCNTTNLSTHLAKYDKTVIYTDPKTGHRFTGKGFK